jgi:hypothetical protein
MTMGLTHQQIFSIRILSVACLAIVSASWLANADDLKDKIIPLRDQAQLIDTILKDRLDTIIPQVMRREGIDAWVLIAREYNEDPVVKTMLPATWLNARRRTVLIFLDHGENKGVERMAIARYGVGDIFKGNWNPEEQPDQWQRIAEILVQFNPKKIALNYSENWAHADGLTYNEHAAFKAALPAQLQSKIMSAEKVAVGWLETRSPKEMEIYKDVMEIAHGIIAEAFSGRVVKPGITSTDDLVWWMRQRINSLGLTTWFHPSIEIERSDVSKADIKEKNLDPNILYKGDHVHTDFGISYLALQTDTQQNAYILRDGETDVPEALKKALKGGNDVQDILTNNFKVGRTGNEILKMSLDQANARNLGPIIYTHPIGLHGHAAGSTIGMWDKQGGVPGDGDYPMHANTAYSIELTAMIEIPEWSKDRFRMKLEEDGFYDGKTFRYIGPRQTKYYIIKPE